MALIIVPKLHEVRANALEPKAIQLKQMKNSVDQQKNARKQTLASGTCGTI